MARPVVLTVAGSDSGGGAGVQADLAAFRARDTFGTSAVTAVTAQHTRGVTASETLAPELVAEQIRAVREDFPVAAAKTGMLGTEPVVQAVASELRDAPFPVVVDPVTVAESGAPLLSPAGESALLESLVPHAALVTPNVPEAERLTDCEVDAVERMAAAGRALVERGADAALVTGGHLDADPTDVLVTAGDRTVRRGSRIAADGTHGSGCTLSAAIAAELAHGADLTDAVVAGREHVRRAIAAGFDHGAGPGPVDAGAPLGTRAALPAALDAVRETVRAFERGGDRVRPLVPEVGVNVAVAPRGARSPGEVAGLDGRLVRVAEGVRATGGPRPGGSDHVARLLCGLRERDRSVRASCNVARGPAVLDAMDALGWTTVSVRREAEPPATRTMDWAAACAMEGRETAPDAIHDAGAVGKEPMVRVVAPDASALRERVFALADRLG